MEENMAFDEEKKEFGQWWVWILCLIIISAVIFTIFNWSSLVIGTDVEREVFKRSYQRSSGLESKIATFEAQLELINGKLRNPNLDPTTESNLLAQKDAIILQINAAKKQQR